MSLDLYIKSKKKNMRSGTGVFVRENGKTIELKTVDEVKAHFPDYDCSEIEEKEYETDIEWHGNQTHNMCEMAEHIKAGEYNLYKLLWHPENLPILEGDRDTEEMLMTSEYRTLVTEGLNYMLNHRDELIKYNPDNGWGSYDTLLRFVIDFVVELSALDLDSGEYYVFAWT